MSLLDADIPDNATVLRVPDRYRVPEATLEHPGHTVYISPDADDPATVILVAVPYDPPEGQSYPDPAPVPLYASARVRVRPGLYRPKVLVTVSNWVDFDGVPHDEAGELTARVRAGLRTFPPNLDR